jgi:3',5'-nucleoside bisphosphate phosphatase
MLIDLQLHSSYSDGRMSPTELAKFISRQGVKVASLTDHNTVAGLEEFKRACRRHKIKPVSGMEFYVRYGRQKFNLLWYNFDDQDPTLHDLLRASQIRRRGQVRRSLEKLNTLGFRIKVNSIIDKYGHYIPVNKIISDILQVGHNLRKIQRELHIKYVREDDVLWNYIVNKKNAGLEETYIEIEQIMYLKKKIGGQLILNHPAKHHQINKEMVQDLKKLGLDGLEVLSPHHSYGAVVHAQHIALEFNFIMTGGSDFHLSENTGYPIKNSWDYFKIDSALLKGVEKIIGLK